MRGDIRGHVWAFRRAGVHSCRHAGGLMLTEVMVAAVILVVAALGALRCQYYAAWHGKLARAQVAVGQIAHLLLEDWKSTGGSTDYNPLDLGLGFSGPLAIPAGFIPAEPLGVALNGAAYAITVNGTPMMVALMVLDVSRDTQAKATLRQLAVVVRFSGGAAGGDTGNSDSRLADMPPVTLATYVRVDASNG